MSTVIRPEISEKNKYWIDRHRYYELKHFCLQYPIWKKAYTALDSLYSSSAEYSDIHNDSSVSDPTARVAEARLYFLDRMRMVERAADEAGADLGHYILVSVTDGLSYEHVKARLEIPCCKDTYYDIYRRFFWILSHARK